MDKSSAWIESPQREQGFEMISFARAAGFNFWGERRERHGARRSGFSLWELMAVVAILGVLAALIVPRVVGNHNNAKRAACFVHQGEIEMQTKLWRRSTGSYPAASLTDIGANAFYFPEGLPTCPVDGTSYTIDTTSGSVIGHTH